MDEYTHRRCASEGDLVGVAFGLAFIIMMFAVGGIFIAVHYASACQA